MENSRGQSSAIGQFISHESSVPRPLLKGSQGSVSKESREITYFKGKKQIWALGNQLHLNEHCKNVAYNFFRLCVVKGITKGRKRAHIIGGCVYLACRTEGTPHMLIDVSDAVETDVFEVGRTYLRLSTALCISIPAIDPCLYIIRFSHKLAFGNKTHEVSETALRLVKRMKKDWMHTGRRPSGVCGAALVIAARFHNFNRTIQDVIKVVKVHESTVRKRLTEFGSTPSSELTPDEFMNNDLIDSEDPPAFKAARRKDEEDKLQKLEEEKDLSNQFTELQVEIDRILRERKKKLHGKHSSACTSGHCTPTSDGYLVNGSEKEASDAVQFIAEATMESIQECISVSGEETMHHEDTMNDMLPTTSSMGLKQSIEESMQIRPSEPAPEESGILDLDGIDDEEIDSYILTDREKESKTSFWMTLNKDYLEEEQKKKEQQKLEEEQRIKEGKPLKQKKVYRRRNKNNEPANTAGEAMERMLKVKKLSNKIDYSVLRNLNGDTDEASETHSIVSRVSMSSRSSKTSKKSTSHHPPIPPSITEIMQSLTKAKSPSEAMHQGLDAEGDSVPLFKKKRLEANDPALAGVSASLDPEDEEDDLEDEEDDLQEASDMGDFEPSKNGLFSTRCPSDDEFEDYE